MKKGSDTKFISHIKELTTHKRGLFQSLFDLSVRFLDLSVSSQILESEVQAKIKELTESGDQNSDSLREYLSSCVRLVELLKNTGGSDMGGLFEEKYGIKKDLAVRMRKRVLESLAGAITEEALYQKISHNRLLDLDYKFSILAKNSDIAKGQCVVALKFTYLPGHGDSLEERSEAKNLFVELNLQQFYKLFGELQKVNSQLDFM